MSARPGIPRPRRGRPRGRVPLNVDPHRFEVAAYILATDVLGLAPYPAGYLVTLAFSDRPIDVRSVEHDLVRFSADVGHATAKGRAGALVRKCQNLQIGPVEIDWLAASVANLAMLANDGPQLAVGGMKAMDDLLALGWRNALDHIFARIHAAASSNWPPLDASEGLKTSRLIADLIVRSEKLRSAK